ncbi:MAG: hypothetical protein KC996_01420 [Phycisphaerales bacterium]|nr:hypothetical protein [Phycisphaerales bacterium]
MDTRRKLSWTAVGISLLGLGPVCSGAITHLDNFEGYPIGSVPPGWVIFGGGSLSVRTPNNHTGVLAPWLAPDFGPGGSQSLCMSVGIGGMSTTAEFAMPSGDTGEFTLDYSIMFTPGMTGTLQVRIYGENPDAPPIGRYSFDLQSGLGESVLTSPDGLEVTNPLANEPGVWTEHMMRMLLDNGPRVCDHCSAITYWSSLSAPNENLTRVEFTLSTNPGSPGGSLYIDDLAITDCPADLVDDGLLDIFDVFAFLNAFNAGSLEVDMNGDGLLDIFDVFEYLDAFNAGCP